MKNTVEIPVEEYEAMQASLKAANERVVTLMEQMAWLQKQIFGQKSERLTDLPQDTPLIPGLELPEPEEAEPETVEVNTHKRKKKGGKGKFTLELPDHLERVEVHIDPPANERVLPDGRKLVRIGEERVEKLAHRPSEYYVKVFVKGIWALPGDSSITPVQEPVPDDVAHGGKLDLSFLSHLIVEKFQFHVPLYRMQEKLGERGISITRSLMSQALGRCGDALMPLAERMKEIILDQRVVFTDDTPVKVQHPGKCRECRIWVHVAGNANAPPYHYYQFTPDRSHAWPKKFLKDFKGTIVADAFKAYVKMHADPLFSLIWAACWAHARRKFVDARSGDPEFKRWVLMKMRHLFMLERLAWKHDPDVRLRIRREKEAPIVDELFARVKAEALKPELLPQSGIAKAVGYLINHEGNFRVYLKDPDVRMDNNVSERSLRKMVIGRKNWLFFGNDKAGERMAALLSLVQTCRAMEVNPEGYLQDVLARIFTHPAKRIDELLPDRWQAAREKEAAEAK